MRLMPSALPCPARDQRHGGVVATVSVSGSGRRAPVVCDDIRPILFANIGDAGDFWDCRNGRECGGPVMPRGRSDFVGAAAQPSAMTQRFQIGQSALKAAARAFGDGLGPRYRAGDLVASRPRAVDSFRMRRRGVAGVHAPDRKIGETVRKAAEHDPGCRHVHYEQARRMAELGARGIPETRLPGGMAPVLLNGGVFERLSAGMVAAFRANLVELGVNRSPTGPRAGHRAALELCARTSATERCSPRVGHGAGTFNSRQECARTRGLPDSLSAVKLLAR